jgi:hypothetical protein
MSEHSLGDHFMCKSTMTPLIVLVIFVGSLTTGCGGGYENLPPPASPPADPSGQTSDSTGTTPDPYASDNSSANSSSDSTAHITDAIEQQQRNIENQSQSNVNQFRQLTQPNNPQNGTGHQGMCLDNGVWVPSHVGCAGSAR